MPVLIAPHKIAAAQWEYDAKITIPDSMPEWSRKLQCLLAKEALYQHEQALTNTQVQEIKARYLETWSVKKDGEVPSEDPLPHFIIGSGTSEDPYKMNYSSFLLTEE